LRRVLICGATGFIGRNLAERFSSDPRYVVTGVHHRRPPFDCPNLSWVQADLTSGEDVNRVLDGQDVVLQAAATTSGVRTTVTRPSDQIVANAVMNSYLFAAALEKQVQHVVFPSCTIMLASSERTQTEEDYDPRVPPLPVYEGAAMTKLYIESMGAFYAKRGGVKFTMLRHSNVYGPYDKYDLQRSHVFGATITKVLSATDGRVSVWGTGEEKRDLLHVDDLVEAFAASIERQQESFGLYNIGRGQAVSVRDLVAMVIKLSGRNLETVYDESKPTAKTSVSLDCRKAERELGWRPKIGLAEGIDRTIAWWRKNRPAG
jgi:nucleoside-diphosphate-sugar epimerase